MLLHRLSITLFYKTPGVMYRAVTWAALRRSLDVKDSGQIGAGSGTATRCAPVNRMIQATSDSVPFLSEAKT